MLHENERAAIGGGAGCLPEYRPPILTAKGLAAPIVFDETVLFLNARLVNATIAMERAAPVEQADILRKISAYAQAMAVIPSRGRVAIDAKRRAAHWCIDFGSHRAQLDGDLCRQLKASADKDQISSA